MGDISHVAAVLLLIYKVESSKSVSGLSLQSQILYTIAFVTRYIDIFSYDQTLYLLVMKALYTSTSAYILYLMLSKYSSTYSKQNDRFHFYYFLPVALFLGLMFNYDHTVNEVSWSFSLWIEAFAIIPQLSIIQRTGEAESITSHYIFAMGSYRIWYILYWLYRHFAQGHIEGIMVAAGVLQTIIYSDFLYLYISRVAKNAKLRLPA